MSLINQIPKIPDSVLHAHQVLIWDKAMREYKDSAASLTDEELDELISCINAGRNTFDDLKHCLPGITSATIMRYLVDTAKNPDFIEITMPVLDDLSRRPRYFQLVAIPRNFIAPYDFKDSDSFKLSIAGENRMYKLRKEHKAELLQFWTIALAALSLIVGIIQSIRV